MEKMFNKETLGLHWFYDNEYTDGYTEKVPPGTGYFFNEESGEWELSPVSLEEQQAAVPEANDYSSVSGKSNTTDL